MSETELLIKLRTIVRGVNRKVTELEDPGEPVIKADVVKTLKAMGFEAIAELLDREE